MSEVALSHGIGCVGIDVDGVALIDGKTGRPLLFRVSVSTRTFVDPRDGLAVNRIMRAMKDPESLPVVR